MTANVSSQLSVYVAEAVEKCTFLLKMPSICKDALKEITEEMTGENLRGKRVKKSLF